ncbi:MAG: hypothetical protein HIU85_09155 [Proteobacteria bacterium]|nr:hypothetical protein [Pseudomonadota bacterium]
MTQMPDRQVLGIPATSIACSMVSHASRASGRARRLLAMELRKVHMSAVLGVSAMQALLEPVDELDEILPIAPGEPRPRAGTLHGDEP